MEKHKSGFVNIIGKPNAGKSTLINALMGEKLSIVSHKPQTTRHRILGILTNPDYQIVFSDTPGILKPGYELHKAMMETVEKSLEDADIILWMIDSLETSDGFDELPLLLGEKKVPLIIAINKMDTVSEILLQKVKAEWNEKFSPSEIICISALEKINLNELMNLILKHLPDAPPYYDEEQWTDRSERFIVSELIREQVYHQFRDEIPYSSEVNIIEFKDQEHLIKIRAEVVCERESQKIILIGKGGTAIKQFGMKARQEIEKFLGRKVYLDLTIKVREGWRNNEQLLKSFGYKN